MHLLLGRDVQVMDYVESVSVVGSPCIKVRQFLEVLL